MRAIYQMFLQYLPSLICLSVTTATDSSCVTRRCLANYLVNQDVVTTQPQSPNCSLNVYLREIDYETIQVDTNRLIFTSILRITMDWQDPDLTWNTSTYPYNLAVLPVDDIWVPSLAVKNAISSTSVPYSSDLVVYSNGKVKYSFYMLIDVGCEVNLFRYPYVVDSCPVFLNGWNIDGCGINLIYGNVSVMNKDRGDWYTISVMWKKDSYDHVYLWVTVSIRTFKPFVTLILPSLLIMAADIFSFALPFEGGERNTFKVTLVLSFVMFLLILSDILPGGNTCSPLIRYHFTVCLILLVGSIMQSMLVSRLAEDGSLFSCSIPLWLKCKCMKGTREEDKEDCQNVSSEQQKDAITLNETTNGFEKESPPDISLKQIARFLEDIEQQERERQRTKGFAYKVDKICLWIYIGLLIIYTGVMWYMIEFYVCDINHLNF
ncbi:5-hydroxytryptamine receptor 3A-like [Arapaima gigas]